MADIRIKDLATTATTSASDDYLALDGSTNGTRKILATNVANNVTDVVFGASGPSAKSSIAARAARQGLVFDGTAGATVSVPAFGTSNFTVIAFINPVSVSNNPYILAGADSTSFSLRVLSGGTARTGLTNGTINTASTSTLTLGKFNVVAYVRSSTTGAYYFDGIAGGTTTDSSNYSTSITKISGDAGGAFILNGTASILIYNRALSAAEVVSLYEAGVPAGADYNNASNTAINTSTAVDGVAGNNTFAATAGGSFTGASTTGFTAVSGGGAYAAASFQPNFSVQTGQIIRVTYTATVNSGTVLAVLMNSGVSGISNSHTVTTGTRTFEFVATAPSTSARVIFGSSAGLACNFSVSSVSIVRSGLLLAPDAAQSGGGLTWYDTSGNAANITLPATGVTWNVPTSGRGIFADGTAAAPSIAFASDSNTGFYLNGADSIGITAGGARQFRIEGSGKLYGGTVNNYLGLESTGSVGLAAAGTNQNITLTPSGTGFVQISNGSNSKILSFYNSSSGGGARIQLADDSSTIDGLTFLKSSGACVVTFGTASKFLIGTTTDSGALLQVGTNTTTSAGGMVFGTDTFLYREAAGTLTVFGSANAFVHTEGTAASSQGFLIKQAGAFVAGMRVAASTSLLLTSGNNTTALTLDSSQNATFVGYVVAGGASVLGWAGRALLSSPADGVIRLSNNAQNDFSRLQFGGTTSSFPALKRSGNSIDVRLADDSAFAAISAAGFYQSTASVSWRSGTGSPESAVTAAVGSLWTRTDGGAGTTLYVKESGTGNTGWVAK